MRDFFNYQNRSLTNLTNIVAHQHNNFSEYVSNAFLKFKDLAVVSLEALTLYKTYKVLNGRIQAVDVEQQNFNGALPNIINNMNGNMDAIRRVFEDIAQRHVELQQQVSAIHSCNCATVDEVNTVLAENYVLKTEFEKLKEEIDSKLNNFVSKETLTNSICRSLFVNGTCTINNKPEDGLKYIEYIFVENYEISLTFKESSYPKAIYFYLEFLNSIFEYNFKTNSGTYKDKSININVPLDKSVAHNKIYLEHYLNENINDISQNDSSYQDLFENNDVNYFVFIENVSGDEIADSLVHIIN